MKMWKQPKQVQRQKRGSMVIYSPTVNKFDKSYGIGDCQLFANYLVIAILFLCSSHLKKRNGASLTSS